MENNESRSSSCTLSIGDRLYCIQDCDSMIEFVKGNFYFVRRIDFDGYVFVSFPFDDKNSSTFGVAGFELYEKRSRRYFHNYFVTMRGLRKLKIEKLNADNLYK